MKPISRWGAWLCLAILLGAASKKPLILATTTSTQDSGLLDVLVPMFEARTGYEVKTIAVGSGQALVLGRRGEADVLLVHSPEAEEKFMAEGYGSRRRAVMHNDFVVLGPGGDPAGVRKTKTTAEAFRKLAASEALFFSRGDDSGTHALEKKLWKASATDPAGKKWYQETGLGMGATLNIAAEKKGYTLSDRGTFLALKKGLTLEVAREGDQSLLNVYHVIEVDAAKRPKVSAAGAAAFAEFMVSEPVQRRIKDFGIAKFGAPLFFPDAR
ncbi:MAG TPA: tungsten ABC transporter substrate-binding protein [Elusimicrobia bacterium]|nr:tungsten ABC transporter substrate-binding protein [Elusimicrobiota bacterium]